MQVEFSKDYKGQPVLRFPECQGEDSEDLKAFIEAHRDSVLSLVPHGYYPIRGWGHTGTPCTWWTIGEKFQVSDHPADPPAPAPQFSLRLAVTGFLSIICAIVLVLIAIEHVHTDCGPLAAVLAAVFTYLGIDSISRGFRRG